MEAVKSQAALEFAVQALDAVRREIGKIIVGQEDVIDGVLICLLCSGHVLLEGVPGLGKTTLLRTLARAMQLKHSRIQFTPDLMPADIVGSMILESAEGGAKSLRGFDEEAFRVDRYVLSSLEWRWFLGPRGQRAFLFWDHASMATRLVVPEGGDRLEVLHRDGLGFGLRLEAAGGLVGVDYGLEPGRPPLEGKIHLQLVSTTFLMQLDKRPL